MLVSASFGLLALFVSAYTVYIQRQQLKVQAWPRLVLASDAQPGSRPDELHFTLSLKNTGVAPAEVRAIRVTFAGDDVTDWVDLLRRIQERRGLEGPFPFSTLQSPAGEVIGVGQAFTLLGGDSRRSAALLDSEDEMTMSFCYCSVLDDCWTLEVPKSGASTTSAVERCPRYATKFVAVPPEATKESARSVLEAAAAGGSDRDASAAPVRKRLDAVPLGD